jgi:putative hemolysin
MSLPAPGVARVPQHRSVCRTSKQAEEPQNVASALTLSKAGLRPAQTLTDGLDWPWRQAVERLPGVAELNRLYVESHARPERRFCDRALATLGVTYEVTGDLEAIPATGPLVVVANHPTGALDGLVLSSLLARRRGDVKMLANHWLGRVAPLRDELLLVDAFGDGRRRNRRPLLEAVRWVRGGAALCVFPSGAVSHFQPGLLATTDPTWHSSVGRLVRLTGASVVACFIDERNGLLFQTAGLLHPWLRTALLPRELIRRRKARVVVHVGRPLAPGTMTDVSHADITQRLREIVYDLPAVAAQATARAASTPSGALEDEVAAFTKSQSLAETGEYSVFWMTAAQAPHLMAAIGRAREVAFQAAGEGTGGEIDVDRFDADYVHLVLWDRSGQTLAGAYRMRPVNPTLQPSALYTRTLFNFDQRLVYALAPGLELGRAFVAPSYQKRHAPLMLLWTGIARYVVAHPEIRHLFGAVSIGAGYSRIARAFMAAYLRRHAIDRLRAPLVTARHPLEFPQTAVVASSAPGGLDAHAFSSTVQALDDEGKGVPVLLRQYLKLNARVLDFSVDPAFSDVLDVLVSIDLPTAPRTQLRRYMGDPGADAYLAHHRRADAISA